MKNETPSPHVSLKLQIMHLKSERFEQQEHIKRSARIIVHSLHPATLARESIHELAEDHDVQVGAMQTALKVGSRFLVFKVLARFGGIAGIVGSTLAGKLSDRFLNKAAPQVLQALGSFLRKDKKYVNEEVFEDVAYEVETMPS